MDCILIVDNSKFMHNFMEKSLKSQCYEKIIHAVDGKDALDALMEHQVDLIISELNMPKVDGLELLRALKNHSELNHIPFIILTSDPGDQMTKDAMEAGAVDYIKKPFTPEEILLKIQSVIKQI